MRKTSSFNFGFCKQLQFEELFAVGGGKPKLFEEFLQNHVEVCSNLEMLSFPFNERNIGVILECSGVYPFQLGEE